MFHSEPSQWYLPALHLHHEGLFDGDPAAVDDHTLRVREVPVVGVLELDGVNHSLLEEMRGFVRVMSGFVVAEFSFQANRSDFFHLLEESEGLLCRNVGAC